MALSNFANRNKRFGSSFTGRAQKGQESTGDSVSRLGRFAQTTEEEKKKKTPDMVGRVQEFAKSEQERQKREAEEKKKKAAASVTTEPQEGFLTRMYKKYVSGGK